MRKLQETVAELRQLVEGDHNFDARMFLSRTFGECLGALRGVSNDLTTVFARWPDMDERLRKELERIQVYVDETGDELLRRESKRPSGSTEGSVPLSGDHRAE